MNSGDLHAVVADTVFDGTNRHERAGVLIEGSRVSRILPRGDIPRNLSVRVLPEGIWLAPGFIDLQANGGGDVLFNDAPTPEAISRIAAAHRGFGTTGFLPTLITDTPEKMHAANAAVQSAMRTEPMVLGLHLEGPFLSPERAGVHDCSLFRQPTSDDVEMLTSARAGALLLTLAPEQVPAGFIKQLTNAGVCVSLGHSNATYAQARAAIGEGLTGFTHLFNAMRPLASREPGPIAAALETPECSYGLIVDGIHVDAAMLRLALRGVGRPMLVTDAMPPVGGTRSEFTLYGEKIAVQDGRCVRQDGTLAGAALDMASAVRNCVRMLGVPLERALRFASSHPAAFVNLATQVGTLAPGLRADMVAFDPETIEVLDTWVAGASQHAA
ncbi:MAG: N-acetylglucosamine-6-phosphate deacetylase [Alphaproteobacteria bacterium]|nr:MAG: N-acetylglucosamine-6-phosphate deacetylase [Alphaproteobacteria bacterium]